MLVNVAHLNQVVIVAIVVVCLASLVFAYVNNRVSERDRARSWEVFTRLHGLVELQINNSALIQERTLAIQAQLVELLEDRGNRDKSNEESD